MTSVGAVLVRSALCSRDSAPDGHGQRAVHAVGAAVGADHVAVAALGGGADDRAALGGGGRAPVDGQRAEAAGVRGQTDVAGARTGERSGAATVSEGLASSAGIKGTLQKIECTDDPGACKACAGKATALRTNRDSLPRAVCCQPASMAARHGFTHHLDEAAQPRGIKPGVRVDQVHRQGLGLPVRHQVQQPSLRDVVGRHPGRDHAHAQAQRRQRCAAHRGCRCSCAGGWAAAPVRRCGCGPA